MATPAQPLQLVVDRITPRLRYACRLLGEVLLRREISPVLEAHSSSGPVLRYSEAPPTSGGLWLQASGWLNQDAPPAPGWAPPPAQAVGMCFPSSHPGSLLPFDVLATLAWLGALGPQATSPLRDKHGRYTGQFSSPVAHLAAKSFADALGWQMPRREPTWEITLDVDQPWLHAYKGFFLPLGGLLRDLLLCRWGRAADRWASLRGKDRYMVYDLIKEKCPLYKTTFFFLLNGNHTNDSRFRSDNIAYVALIRLLTSPQGYNGGIHPSYLSSDQMPLLSSQKEALEHLMQRMVTASRQHYLRYQVPGTLAELERIGIRREYSLAPLGAPGFVNGFCVPHPWFDLWANRESELWLVPSVMMDRGLLNAGLSPAAGAEAISAIRTQVREVGGHFVPVLHNETFSNHGDWQGWTPVFLDMLDSLGQHGV